MYSPTGRGLQPVAYVDADYCGDAETGGYVIYLAGGFIKLQPVVAQSSTMSEYIALAAVGNELCWLTMLLGELGIASREPAVILADNTAAVAMADDPFAHQRSKHINTRYLAV